MRIAILLSTILLAALAAVYSLRLPATPTLTHPSGWVPGAPAMAGHPPPPTIAPGVMLDRLAVGDLRAPTAAALVSWLAPLWDHPPVDASIDHATGMVRPGQRGWRLDAAKTLAALLAAGPGQEVAPVLETVAPRWPAESLQNLSAPLASFQTKITGEPNRVYNMELAASLLNNTLVLPGQVFSFNAVVGPYDAARGYLSAPVIVDDRYESGLGGGVCQLSSTLYQAVLNLGLTVVERHPHTLPVPYVPPGHDATVAGSLDFRFRNNLATPLVIKASRQGDNLVVTLLGRKIDAGSGSPAVP